MSKPGILTIATFAAAAALTGAAAASAAPLSDAQYIAAARCQGLYQSRALGASDASGINALMKSEGARVPAVLDSADQARDDARRAADRANGYSKAQLISERDGACQVWASNGAATAHR